RRPVPLGRREQPTDVVPRGAGRQRVVGEDAGPLDRLGQAPAAPAAGLRVAEEGPQVDGEAAHGDPRVTGPADRRQERLVDLADADLVKGAAGGDEQAEEPTERPAA